MDEPADTHIPRKAFGYDRDVVDRLLADRNATEARLSADLSTTRTEQDKLSSELRAARQEARYWSDRQAYIDGEAERVRGVVEEILGDARTAAVDMTSVARDQARGIVLGAQEEAASIRVAARDEAQTIETEARERAMQVLDRVCAQSDEIIERANTTADRVAARSARAQAEAQDQLDAILALSRQIEEKIRRTLRTFEHAVDELGTMERSTAQALPETMARAIRAGAADAVQSIDDAYPSPSQAERPRRFRRSEGSDVTVLRAVVSADE